MMLSCLLANVDTNDGLLLSNHPSCVHFVVNEAKANAEAMLCVIVSTDGKAPLQPPEVSPKLLSASFFHVLRWLTGSLYSQEEGAHLC